jgi:hypothetical protein
MMCLWTLYKKKIFFCILKINDESDPELNPDPLVRGTDPGIWIRIRTKCFGSPVLTVRNVKVVRKASRNDRLD